ncbi:CPBP family intramembrane glutamic endopeptidase [Thalassotalea hakodatensis]|uniref:CPBP family intramembrane glutamic endopeptidase n=1 Tax=Thalassotalea hakodatensis TaxID=3030492 RepID=UPI00257247BB|nr:CPBP family intramembrane glutamic endopeptidase [Thalassotalea hakodatensis]
MININALKTGEASIVLLLLVLILEGPVRLFLQPDPWLLHPTHWYFNQPTRLLVELTVVIVALLVLYKSFARLLFIDKTYIPLMIVASLSSALIFAILELEQLKESFNTPLGNIMLWLMTGFIIGVGQEVVYRGLLFTSLTAYFTARGSSLITTLIFVIAPLHSIRLWELYKLEEYHVVLILITIYVAVSFLFQWLRDKSNSIIVPGVVHGVGNAITWLAVFS